MTGFSCVSDLGSILEKVSHESPAFQRVKDLRRICVQMFDAVQPRKPRKLSKKILFQVLLIFF